ncbi:MAG: efflux RND transporter periplasmic adaptor subunit [Campylobacterales bacterium]|nr:efflux RND transporter periplasmic adaptor subunit [Campylobacterales bacterium]
MVKNLFILIVLFALSLNAKEIYATFDVEAIKKSELSLSVAGVVSKIYVDIGDVVKKGDLLLELENSDFKADILVKKSQVELAQTALDYAMKSFSRYDKVKDIIDKEHFDKFEADKNIKTKELLKAKNELLLKEAMFEKTKLYAPYNGVITNRYVELGDGVNGAMSKLFFMEDNSEVKLILSFDEKYWKDVKKGVLFKFKVDGDDTLHEGYISKIYPTIQNSNRKMKAEVITKGILSGLFGDGTIVVDK